jgi:dGTPase
VKSDWEYFYRKRKEIQRSTAKEWQDLIDFEGNANGFTVLTGSRPGIEGGLRISLLLWEHYEIPKESLPKKPTTNIADKKVWLFKLIRYSLKK